MSTLQRIPAKPTRKQKLPWLESRLRRLRYTKTPTDRQKKRIKVLEKAIAELRRAIPTG